MQQEAVLCVASDWLVEHFSGRIQVWRLSTTTEIQAAKISVYYNHRRCYSSAILLLSHL